MTPARAAMLARRRRTLTALAHTLLGLLLVVACSLVLSACGNDPAEPGGPSGVFRVAQVNVDGRLVNCVTWKHGYAGGLSCDWTSR
jgi:hypothetical protein